jgi:hypothetical protein
MRAYKLFGLVLILVFLVVSGSALAAAPSTSTYKLNSYGFGSGGTANSGTSTYSLEGISGEISGQTQSTSNYIAKPGFIQTQQAYVPKVSLSNPGNYFDKLKFIIDTQSNPTDATYALQVKVNDVTCNFSTGTIRYVKSDLTLGSTLTTADYLNYTTWGGASGSYAIGLSPGTTYCIRAKATQGKFTESAYGPSASAATLSPNLSFCTYTSSSCSTTTTLSLGALTAGTITTSTSSIGVDFATNASLGGNVYIYSSTGSLTSSSASSAISSASADLSTANSGYGAQATMAAAGFPSTPVLDDFNRTNSATLGANWTITSGNVTNFSVGSNQAHDANAVRFGWDYWNASTFGPDSEVYATVATASSDARRVCLRFDPTGGNSGYCLNQISNTWTLLRLAGGPSTQLGAAYTQNLNVGDKIGLRAVGTQLEAWYYDSSISTWIPLFSRTDSTYTGANYIALESRASDIDDFGGGNFSSSYGSFSVVSPYDATSNSVGALSTNVSTVFSSSAALVGGRGKIQLLAKPAATTASATDYADTLTLIAAAAF